MMTQTTDVLAKIVALRDELAATLLERETAIETALLALLTGEHLLLLGPPGTAKSMLVRAICERIEGASYFERLLTAFQTPGGAVRPAVTVGAGAGPLSACHLRRTGRGPHRVPGRGIQGQLVDLERPTRA
jgi:ABC-type hemin transport system ATPase subunit